MIQWAPVRKSFFVPPVFVVVAFSNQVENKKIVVAWNFSASLKQNETSSTIKLFDFRHTITRQTFNHLDRRSLSTTPEIMLVWFPLASENHLITFSWRKQRPFCYERCDFKHFDIINGCTKLSSRFEFCKQFFIFKLKRTLWENNLLSSDFRKLAKFENRLRKKWKFSYFSLNYWWINPEFAFYLWLEDWFPFLIRCEA